MYKLLFKNPITILFVRALRNYILAKKFKKQSLKIGDMCLLFGCKFGNMNTINDDVTLYNVELGDFTYIAKGTKINNASIGKYCSIGPDIIIGTGKHPSNTFVSTHPLFYSTLGQAQSVLCDRNYFDEFAPITIGHDVWIGARSIILDGINISNGAIIAAGSLVTKDVPPYAIVGGVPAKIIKYRFKELEINFLLKYKWWDRDICWLKKNLSSMHNINEFINNINETDPTVYTSLIR